MESLYELVRSEIAELGMARFILSSKLKARRL